VVLQVLGDFPPSVRPSGKRNLLPSALCGTIKPADVECHRFVETRVGCCRKYQIQLPLFEQFPKKHGIKYLLCMYPWKCTSNQPASETKIVYTWHNWGAYRRIINRTVGKAQRSFASLGYASTTSSSTFLIL
jgi:hypothetical protein